MSETLTAAPLYDTGAAENFAERIMEILDSGAIGLMLAFGHRAGLFASMAGQGPRGSVEIADAAGLSERYVREWLAAMVTGRIVHYDPDTKTYWLPAEHAACLTPEAALGNLAVYAQVLPLAGGAQETLLDRLKNGGGTSYNDYPCFHQFMSEDSGQTVVAQLFETLLPLAPGLPDRLAAGIDVLDAGCGRGLALIAMAERYPESRFTGYDLCPEAIAFARDEAAAARLANVRFAVKDLTGFSEPERYDLITSFDAVHDQKDPQGLLTGIHGALRPGGVYLMQDIGGSSALENNLDFPMAPFLYTISFTHCMPVSLGQGGEGLGAMWGWETAERMLHTAGFAAPKRNVLPHDPMNVWFVSRKT